MLYEGLQTTKLGTHAVWSCSLSVGGTVGGEPSVESSSFDNNWWVFCRIANMTELKLFAETKKGWTQTGFGALSSCWPLRNVRIRGYVRQRVKYKRVSFLQHDSRTWVTFFRRLYPPLPPTNFWHRLIKVFNIKGTNIIPKNPQY